MLIQNILIRGTKGNILNKSNQIVTILKIMINSTPLNYQIIINTCRNDQFKLKVDQIPDNIKIQKRIHIIV